MKTNSLAKSPMSVQEYSLTAFSASRRQQAGVVKLLPAPPPPDEKTLKELNALAAKHPFCVSYKVKKHDPL